MPSAQPQRRRSHGFRHLLKRLHLWLGISVGTVYALVALSGSVLVLQTPLLRLAHPALAAHALPDANQRAEVLARIASRWQPAGLRAADLPTAALPVWQLYFADGTRRYLDPADGHLLLARTVRSDLLLTVHDWHTHLLAGAAGERLLGILGCLALGLLLSGLVLWWPGHRRLRGSLRTWTQPPTRRWFSWHRSVGALALPLLLPVTLTGTLMVYSHATRQVLQTAFGEQPSVPDTRPVMPQSHAIDWAAVLGMAQRALPGAALHRIMLPSTLGQPMVIRARAVGEWHPVGRSEIRLDPWRVRVLARADASAAGPGTRASHVIYPLHAGAVGGMPGRLLVLLAGGLPAFFLVTGLLFWRARTRRGQ